LTSPSTAAPTPDPAAPVEGAALAVPVAPVEYTDFTPPEGYTLSKDLLASALPVMKELGLNQAQAQKLVDFYSANAIAQAKLIETETARMRKDWTDKVAADPELGPNLDRIKLTISRALDGLGDPQLRKDFGFAMDLTGAGDNPAFIKVLAKLAERAVEGTHVAGAGPSAAGQTPPGSAKPSIARAMYPNLS
jgi:hypothetical protein